jgi:hypothetical protein
MPGAKLSEDILSPNPNYNKEYYERDEGNDRLNHSYYLYDLEKIKFDYQNVRDDEKDVAPTPIE